MYQDRVEMYKKLEQEYDSKLLLYVTSSRQNMGAQIAGDVVDFFIEHLDKIDPTKKISLYLYTNGGNTAVARNIVNLLHMYCEELQVIVPRRAHSAGTLMCLGANEIVMTKQATLSPIDPSLQSPLGPRIDKIIQPVSVEAVKGYLEFAKNELGIKDENSLADIYIRLSDYVHPLVLGQVYRSKAQIQMVASELLQYQDITTDKKQKIIDFLCSESGSHDYTINRREARDDLGLNIRTPNDKQYAVIKQIYDDISDELQFKTPFSPSNENGEYAARRSLLESVNAGSNFFITEGIITKNEDPSGKIYLNNQIVFDGWRHDCVNEEQKLCVKDGEGEVVYESIPEYQP